MTAPSRPLVIRFGALGDLIMTLPAARALAAQYGEPVTVIAHGGWATPLLAGLPFVGEIAHLSSRGLPYLLSPQQQRLVRFMANHAGPAYLLEFDKKSASLCARAGLTMAGSVSAAGYRDDEHQVDLNARACGVDGPGFRRDPELFVSHEDLAAARAWLSEIGLQGDFVIIHPGNKRTQIRKGHNHKSWAAERWVETIRAVRAAGLPVLLTGTAKEQALCRPLAAHFDSGVTNIAGQTPIRRLLALLRMAHSAISVDTGPAHAAAAIGCPLVVLFGRTDPRVSGPIGLSPVRIVTGPADALVVSGQRGWWEHHCMEAISASQVIAAWQGLGARS
jgi:heptosyltransferase-2/heptosyltransferase-3